MKRYNIFVIIPLLVFVLLGLVMFGLRNYQLKEAKRTQLAKEPLKENTYLAKILDMLTSTQKVINAKFVYAGQEVTFIPKADAAGNAAAIAFYQSGKKSLEEMRKKLLAINPPFNAEYMTIKDILNTALSSYIMAYDKAIESLNKDDFNIMKTKMASLLQEGSRFMNQIPKELAKIKSK